MGVTMDLDSDNVNEPESRGDLPLPVTISFSGCGFLGAYHVGVAGCLQQHPHLIKIEKALGSSAGALIATAIMAEVPARLMVSDVFNIAHKARAGVFGPFSPSFSMVNNVREGLRDTFPLDAHTKCTDRVVVSLTRVQDNENVLVEEFQTREELIQALVCSTFVPVLSGVIPPMFRGHRYWDGGISDNLPLYDEQTITVSPFACSSDICPEKSEDSIELSIVNQTFDWNTNNFSRMRRAMMPETPEGLRNLVREGYKDALRFLIRTFSSTVFNPSTAVKVFELNSEPTSMKPIRRVKTFASTGSKISAESPRNLDTDIPQELIEFHYDLPQEVKDIIDHECSSDYFSDDHTPFSLIPIPWTLPFDMTVSWALSLVEKLPNKTVRWWQGMHQNSLLKRSIIHVSKKLDKVILRILKEEEGRSNRWTTRALVYKRVYRHVSGQVEKPLNLVRRASESVLSQNLIKSASSVFNGWEFEEEIDGNPNLPRAINRSASFHVLLEEYSKMKDKTTLPVVEEIEENENDEPMSDFLNRNDDSGHFNIDFHDSDYNGKRRSSIFNVGEWDE